MKFLCDENIYKESQKTLQGQKLNFFSFKFLQFSLLRLLLRSVVNSMCDDILLLYELSDSFLETYFYLGSLKMTVGDKMLSHLCYAN